MHRPPVIRRFAAFTATIGAAVVLGGCEKSPVNTEGPSQELIDNATIELHPPTGPTGTVAPGMYELGLGTARDGWFYVPSNYDPAVPTPLLVLLHPAGGSSADWDTPELRAQYDANGMIVIAPDSRFETWDVRVLGEYHADVDFLQAALEKVFDVARVDPERMAIGGFSDGASEALGVGLANAHLFSRIVGFSPGMLYAPFARGRPQIYITHGTLDDVLPFWHTRDVIVITLVRNNHSVIFREFEEGHKIPQNLLIDALQWAAAPRNSE